MTKVQYIGNVKRRHMVFEDSDIVKVELEELDGMAFIHVELRDWNKAIAEYLMALWEELKIHLWVDGYDQLFTYNGNMKFMKLISKQEWHKCSEDNVYNVEVHYTDIGAP